MNVSIARDGVKIGEWTEDQVRAFYANGQLLTTDYYWKEGMTEWALLSAMIKPPLSESIAPKTPKAAALEPIAVKNPSTLPAEKPIPFTQNPPKAVRGWLLLFCLVQLIWRPALYLNQALDMWRVTDAFSTVILSLIPGLLAVYSIITAVKLLMHSPNAVKFTKIFLVIVAFQTLYFMLAGLALAAIHGRDISTSLQTFWNHKDIVKGCVQHIGYSIIWFWYFSASKRVKETYEN